MAFLRVGPKLWVILTSDLFISYPPFEVPGAEPDFRGVTFFQDYLEH